MIVQLECCYCGYKWEKIVYNKQSVEDEKCPKCSDTSLIVRDATAKIDPYKGCPSFPDKIRGKDWVFGIDGLEEIDDYNVGGD